MPPPTPTIAPTRRRLFRSAAETRAEQTAGVSGAEPASVTNPLLRVAGVVGLAFAITFGAWSIQDYQTDLGEEKSHALAVAQLNASLIDAVTRFEIGVSPGELPSAAAPAALAESADLYLRTADRDHGSEIVVFRRDGDALSVILHHGAGGHEHSIDVDSPYGRELVKALTGEAGVFDSEGPHGRPALVAYAPIPAASWGLFVATDLWDVQQPILQRVAIIFGLVVAVLAVLFSWIRGQIAPLVAAVEEREARFRDYAGSASEWFWEMGPDLRFTLSFPGTHQQRGHGLASYRGLRRQDLAAEDTTTEKWRRHQDDLESRRPFRGFAFDMRQASGSVCRVRVNGVPFYDAKGQFAGYRGTGSDITEEAAAERRLSEANERARAAFENVTVGCVMITPDGTIEAFNACAERIFGYDRHEVLGRNVSMLMPGPLAGQHDAHLSRYRRTGEARVIGTGRETTGRRKTGEEFPVHLGVAEMRVGDSLHFIGSITDLTREKRLAQQLRWSQKMDAVGQLTGGVAHDFNNILGIILGNLDLVRRRLSSDSPVSRPLDRAIGAVERGARLTRRLLNFSRQTPASAVSTVDINRVTQGLEELLGRSLTPSITIEMRLDEALWPAKADPAELEDALTNLVLNARDAMPSGGRLVIETGNVTVAPGEPAGVLDLPAGDYARVTVSDTGTGMPTAVLERIFEPFFTTKDASSGTGLGLPMVYGFAKRCGGGISACSEEGVGSTFLLYLPRSTAAAAPRADAPSAPSGLPRGTERVLVVDDEPALREIARAVLSDLGYSVTVAECAEEALTCLEGDPSIDLLFSDVVMPGAMNGLALAEAARALRPGLRIVLTSGFSVSLLAPHEVERGSAAILSKPYSNTRLAHAVRDALDTPGDGT